MVSADVNIAAGSVTSPGVMGMKQEHECVICVQEFVLVCERASGVQS